MSPDRSPRDPNREQRLWTAPFILFSMANMGVSTVFYLLVPTMAPFATQRFGAEPGQAGLAASIFFIGALVMRVFAGGIVSRLGLRRSVVVSLLVATVSVAAYLLVASLPVLYVVRFVHGSLFALVQTALTATVMASVPPNRRGEGAGWFTAGLAIMTGLGPAIGFELLSRWGMVWVFVAAFVASIGSVLLGLAAVRLMPETPPTERRSARDDGTRGGRRRLPDMSRLLAREAVGVGLVVACAAVAYASVISFLASHAEAAGLQSAVGPYFLAYAAASFVARPIAGPIQDRRGDVGIFVPALLSAAAGAALTAVSTSVPIVVLGGALLGGGYGTLISAGQASAVTRSGTGRAGSAVSSFFLCVDAATGLAPALLGLFGDAIGYPGIFLAGAGATLLGLVGFLLGPARSGPKGWAHEGRD